jgi:hypothetical protein
MEKPNRRPLATIMIQKIKDRPQPIPATYLVGLGVFWFLTRS